MKIRQERDRLVVRHTPGCLWLLGLMFVGSGTVASAGALVGFAGDEAMPLWGRALVLTIGVAHLAGALWLLRTSPATELVADRAKAAGVGTVVFDRAGNKYAGRVAAVADGAREGGLEF